jgi:uncharacterized protein YndB with AHSA1/START domain
MTSVVSRMSATEVAVRWRFTAPPAAVFAGLTTPALLRQWMNAGGRPLVDVENDVRSGGRYRYAFRSASGRGLVMFGDFLEVLPERRIVHTERYEGYDWAPLVTTTDLEPDGAGTLLAMVIRYADASTCDSDFPNIESSAAAGFTRLEAALAGGVSGR